MKEIKRVGCYKTREDSNHEIWISPITGKKFQIPRHYSPELPTGTKKNIRNMAGLMGGEDF